MRITAENTDATVLAELGRRFARARIAANLPQAELAAKAGVSERTVRNLERGGSGVQLTTLVRVMRALGLGELIDGLLPEGGPTPIELVEMRRRERRRASGTRRPKPVAKPPWRWGDEA